MSTLTKTILAVLTITTSLNVMAYGFYDQFPSCKVYKESNCNDFNATVGAKMQCYRSFLDRKSKCLTNTRRFFKEWERDNKIYEENKRAEVKKIAVIRIDKNYSNFTNKKIDDQDLKTINKFEGAQALREMLSYINRVLIPATKIASESFDALLKEAQSLIILRSQGDASFAVKFVDFSERHSVLSQKINVITKNYQTYSDLNRPKILGLRFEENIQNTSETLEATKLLIVNAFEIERSLTGMMLPFKENSRTDKTNKLKVRTATKREILLQKIFQAQEKLKVSDSLDTRRDLDFLVKICSFEFQEDNEICLQSGEK